MTLTVTQNTTQNNLTITQSNVVVKLQPVINASAQIVETDPIFQASEASLFVAGDKANLDNQSGVNTGDETTLSIQTKRPLKTVNGESLEGSGNVQINYNDLDNLPTIPTVITNHSDLNLDDGTNPHGTTKDDVGLSNVDNTSDLNKIISTATQTALNAKANISGQVFTGAVSAPNLSGTNTGDETTSSIQTKRPLKTIEGQSLEGSGNIDLTKNNIGLGNVDNTSDLNKPISTATQTALDLKENVANKATDLLIPDDTKYPTTLAVVNENKKVTITVELINQLTTDFYAPNPLRISSISNVKNAPTTTIKVNDVAYTLGNLIAKGDKITVETNIFSVVNLNAKYE